MLDNIGLMNGLGGKMNWLQQRQSVISQNISNADTPNYRPSDLEEVDFESVMRATRNRPSIAPAATNSAHIGANREVGTADNRTSRDVYEAAPSENSVILEEQLLKAQATQSDYALITNLYKKNIGMIKFVISK